MPARLLIESDSGESECWIEQPVIRVGSDAHCDLQIQGSSVAGHALTLEYQNGEYRIHNRASHAIALGSSAIEPGQSSIWTSGDELRIDGSTTLILECNGDPAPVASPNDREQQVVIDYSVSEDEHYEIDEYDDEPNEALPGDTEGSSIDATTVLQMAVIACCLVGIVLILIAKMGAGGAEAVIEKVPTVAELAEIVPGEQYDERLLRRLQQAELARVRGQREAAANDFAAIRDELARKQQLSSGSETAPEWTTSMRILIQDRLSRLNE